MNDFTELENELKKLRPIPPTAGLQERIEQAMRDQGDDGQSKIIEPARFKLNWISLGAGLAAAAIILIFSRIDHDRAPKQPTRLAQASPAATTRSTMTSAEFIPAGATHVVYNTRDEGLHYTPNSNEPVRRMRYQKQESLQWRNPQTGASLRVTYPSEEVVLVPVSGQ